MITLLLLIPILVFFLFYPIPVNGWSPHIQMKKIILIIFLINFFLYIWSQFDFNTTQYQFISEFNQINLCHLNLLRIKSFHTSCVKNSNSRIVTLRDILDRPSENERLSNLQRIKYEQDVSLEEVDNLEINMSTYEESFPWLLDENGKIIDYNKSITLFNAIKLISHFLEKRFGGDKNEISEVKLAEIIKIFTENKDVTVMDLFTHVSNLYKNDKDSVKILSDVLNIENNESSLNTNNTNISESSQPLGRFGEITLNDLAVYIRDKNWELKLDRLQLTVNPLPLTMNFISYNLIIKSYMKYVHNRPYSPNLDTVKRNLEIRYRNRQLGLFVFIGAPFILYCINKSAISMKERGSISIGKSTESDTGNNSLIYSSLFLFLSNITKKIPDWLKFIFKLLLLTSIIFKLLGFSSILVIFDSSKYLKLYIYIICSLIIFYLFFNIFMLYIFYKKIKIPEILPEFLINSLTDFEIMCETKESFKHFKNLFYIEILVHLLVIILASIIL